MALFLLAHLLSSPSRPTVDTASGTIAAKWTADLRAALGSPPLGLVVGRGHETLLPPKTSLWFLDNNTIAITFVTREEKAVLSGRDSSDTNLPLRLRVFFLDADVGKIISTQSWPSESRFAGIVVTSDGKFVTQRGTTLTLYSSDAKERGELSLPTIGEDLWGWAAHPSPTGKNILFATPNLTKTLATPWIWVDTATLQVVRSWMEMQSGWVGISDHATAMIACSFPLDHCEPNLEIRSLATEWKAIAPLERQPQSSPRFLNEDILFLSGHPWKLLQTDGKVVFTESAPFEGKVAIPSAGGERFVVPFFKSTGKISVLDIGAHGELTTISVYDAPFRARSYKLGMIGPKIKDQGTQLALSPNGSLLAILCDESVYVFQLPPAATTPPPNRPIFP